MTPLMSKKTKRSLNMRHIKKVVLLGEMQRLRKGIESVGEESYKIRQLAGRLVRKADQWRCV